MAKRAKVHASMPGVQRQGICGWPSVETEADITKVTCKACLRLLRAGSGPRTGRRRNPLLDGAELANDLRAELGLSRGSDLVAAAPFPPRLSPPVWACVCRSEHRRCGECALCAWEREAERYAFAAPWKRVHAVRRPEGAPAWPSFVAALRALLEAEASPPSVESAQGRQIDRAQRGESGTGERGQRGTGDSNQRRVERMHPVDRALVRAYQPAQRWELPPGLTIENCKRILMARKKGVLDEVVPYEQLGAAYVVTEGVLKSVVKRGAVAEMDLYERGLIPRPKSGRESSPDTWDANYWRADFGNVAGWAALRSEGAE